MEQEAIVGKKKEIVRSSARKQEDEYARSKKLIPFLDEPYNAEFDVMDQRDIEAKNNRIRELEQENAEFKVICMLFQSNRERLKI